MPKEPQHPFERQQDPEDEIDRVGEQLLKEERTESKALLTRIRESETMLKLVKAFAFSSVLATGVLKAEKAQADMIPVDDISLSAQLPDGFDGVDPDLDSDPKPDGPAQQESDFKDNQTTLTKKIDNLIDSLRSLEVEDAPDSFVYEVESSFQNEEYRHEENFRTDEGKRIKELQGRALRVRGFSGVTNQETHEDENYSTSKMFRSTTQITEASGIEVIVDDQREPRRFKGIGRSPNEAILEALADASVYGEQNVTSGAQNRISSEMSEAGSGEFSDSFTDATLSTYDNYIADWSIEKVETITRSDGTKLYRASINASIGKDSSAN